MSRALLDINDSNLRLWHGESLVQSPGYALLEGGEYRFGGPARAAARLRPRDVATRYWWQLGTRPLQPALGPARHTADLVHAHLLALHAEAGAPDELLLAVPDSLSREQLALLLGIIEQCPFDAVGLVNRSVALARAAPDDGTLYHLEFQLHQALLTELENRDGESRLVRSQALPGCGLLQLQERLVEVIAATFIRQTRFDPRRQAATEQQLYDALPRTLQSLQSGRETQLELSGYTARLEAAGLREAGERLFKALEETTGKRGGRLLADPLAALLPGLAQQFPGLQLLPEHALRESLPLLAEEAASPGQPLALVTRLPLPASPTPAPTPAPEVQARETPAPAPAVTSAPAATAPTHLLRGFLAEPLAAAGTDLGGGWSLAREGRQWLLQGGRGANPATVNGQPATAGRALHCGDTLVIDGAGTCFVIHVPGADGST